MPRQQRHHSDSGIYHIILRGIALLVSAGANYRQASRITGVSYELCRRYGGYRRPSELTGTVHG